MQLRRLPALAMLGLATVCLTASTAWTAEPEARLVPPDSDMLAVGNYQQLIGSAMFKKHGLEPFKQTLQDPQLKQALQALGLDPLKDIDTVIVSNSGKLDKTGKLFIAVKGRFDLTKIQAAAKNEGLKVHMVGNLTIYETKGDDPAFIAVPDANTLVLSTRKDYLADVLTPGKIQPGKNAKELKAALARANTRDTIYFGMVVTSEMKDELRKNPQVAPVVDKLLSVTGSVAVSDVAQVELLVNTTDAQTAGQLSKAIKDFLPLLKVLLKSQDGIPSVVIDVIDQTKIGTNKESVTISIKVTDEIVEKAIKGK
jgi:hypothetical protein